MMNENQVFISTRTKKTRILSKGEAIKSFCTKCMVRKMHPIFCKNKDCPLHPFRGKAEY